MNFKTVSTALVALLFCTQLLPAEESDLSTVPQHEIVEADIDLLRTTTNAILKIAGKPTHVLQTDYSHEGEDYIHRLLELNEDAEVVVVGDGVSVTHPGGLTLPEGRVPRGIEIDPETDP